MVNSVSQTNGESYHANINNGDQYRAHVYTHGLKEDSLEISSAQHGIGGGNHSGRKEGLISRSIAKVKQVLWDFITLPKVMWDEFRGKESQHGHKNPLIPDEALPTPYGPNPFLAPKGFLSEEFRDERGAMF